MKTVLIDGHEINIHTSFQDKEFSSKNDARVSLIDSMGHELSKEESAPFIENDNGVFKIFEWDFN